MGAYIEYLSKSLSLDKLREERQKQLERIKAIRKRDVVVYASDLVKDGPTGINYDDLPPFYELLANVKTTNVDVLIETPGGDAVIVEDMVKRIRARFKKFGVIVPGSAKSAGTIFAMAADEILMSQESSLGPIDAQVSRGGRTFSASAFLKGFDDLFRQYETSGVINPIYIPILKNISLGEIEHFKNAQAFAQVLVATWLSTYKFKNWIKHRDGRVVTDEEKKARAEWIAKCLGDQSRWLTHARSIRMEDLEALKLKVTDVDTVGGLGDAVRRYHTLLRLTFASSIYKIFETSDGCITERLRSPRSHSGRVDLEDSSIIEVHCLKCQNKAVFQLNFKVGASAVFGAAAFPADGVFRCSRCGASFDISNLKKQIEKEVGRAVV